MRRRRRRSINDVSKVKGTASAGSRSSLDYPSSAPDYHLFEATELETLVDEAVTALQQSDPSLRVDRENSGWERGNWWGIWTVAAVKT